MLKNGINIKLIVGCISRWYSLQMTTPDIRATYAKLLSGVCAISISALMVKQVSMAPTVSAFWRVFYAAILIYIIYLWRCNTAVSKNTHNNKWMVPALLAGIFLAVDMVIWHKSIISIGAGPATFLGNSQVIFVTIFGAVVFREKIGKLFILTFPIVLGGLYLLIPSFQAGAMRSSAYAMGLSVGLTYAGFLLCLRYAKQASADQYPQTLSLSFIMMVTAVGIAIWGIGVEKITMFSGSVKDHLAMAAISLIANTLGWMLIKTNITLIPAHQGSLLLLLQPVLTTIWAGLFFGESISPIQLTGAIMVVAGISAYQLSMECRRQKGTFTQ